MQSSSAKGAFGETPIYAADVRTRAATSANTVATRRPGLEIQILAPMAMLCAHHLAGELLTTLADFVMEAAAAVGLAKPPPKGNVAGPSRALGHRWKSKQQGEDYDFIYKRLPKLHALLADANRIYYYGTRAQITVTAAKNDRTAANHDNERNTGPYQWQAALAEASLIDRLDPVSSFLRSSGRDDAPLNKMYYNQAALVERELFSRRQCCTAECRATTGCKGPWEGKPRMGPQCTCGAMYLPPPVPSAQSSSQSTPLHDERAKLEAENIAKQTDQTFLIRVAEWNQHNRQPVEGRTRYQRTPARIIDCNLFRPGSPPRPRNPGLLMGVGKQTDAEGRLIDLPTSLQQFWKAPATPDTPA